MATLVLASAGGSAFGPVGSVFGALAGNFVDNGLLGMAMGPQSNVRVGDVVGSLKGVYGTTIPIVIGTSRLKGSIIWAKKSQNMSSVTVGDFSQSYGSNKTRTYSNVSLAFALCEGEVDEVSRMWINKIPVDMSSLNVRIYRGSETQMPDPIIDADANGSAPAYRGLAYVVIENFSVAEYGGRIPVFDFEVSRTKLDIATKDLLANIRDDVTGLVLAADGGEFIYDTDVQTVTTGRINKKGRFEPYGASVPINNNTDREISDFMVSVDKLQRSMPNVKWVSLVVDWFVDKATIDSATIMYPAVDNSTSVISEPDAWSVAGIDRRKARQVVRSGSGIVRGGTISDASLLRSVRFLQSKGYKVALSLKVAINNLTDMDQKITGDVLDVDRFFTRSDGGYNAFVLHYANLLAGAVDMISIGSAMKGMTSLQHGDGSFPAVDNMVLLAGMVRKVVGSSTKITYSADWDEYHSFNKIYNMDKLWSCADIDVVGINAYFPLTNKPQNEIGYNVADLVSCWQSGEGYDYYYSDNSRTNKIYYKTPTYAWKNIRHWWGSAHVGADGHNTLWVPQSKKIWFMEYGFASIDGTANKPDALYANHTQKPPYSVGDVDMSAQAVAIAAAINYQKSSLDMIEGSFLYKYDVRPYPYYPNLSKAWYDKGENWSRGYDVQGKIDRLTIDSVVRYLSSRGSIDPGSISVSGLHNMFMGIAVTNRTAVRSLLETLRYYYFFDIVSDGTNILCRGFESGAKWHVSEEDMLRWGGKVFELIIDDEADCPTIMEVGYIDANGEYEAEEAVSNSVIFSHRKSVRIASGVSMDHESAQRIADRLLLRAYEERRKYKFSLSMKYARVIPGDLLYVNYKGQDHIVRVLTVEKSNRVSISGVAYRSWSYNMYAGARDYTNYFNIRDDVGLTRLHVFEVHDATNDYALYCAVSGVSSGWRGAAIYQTNDGGDNYSHVADVYSPSTVGTVSNVLLPPESCGLIDSANYIVVSLWSGDLHSTVRDDLFLGGNYALIGREIVQFQNVTMLSEGVYVLNVLLRGCFGTEKYASQHSAAEEFVLLNGGVVKLPQSRQSVGLRMSMTAVSLERYSAGVGLGEGWKDALHSAISTKSHNYNASALRPLSVVRLEASRGSNGDINVSWIRRTRVNGELRDGVDVALDEEREMYGVRMSLSGGSFSKVFDVGSQEKLVYSHDQQIADGAPSSGIINIDVWQVSAAVGAGDISTVQLTVQ